MSTTMLQVSPEVDVFTIPHNRMKELVNMYNEKLSCTDFSSMRGLQTLLNSLKLVFNEFISHEDIENNYIMDKLKRRLAVSHLHEFVFQCHNNSNLRQMLDLVSEGYAYSRKSKLERQNYGRKLREELTSFTETFLPHMQEEEQVFQPMLMEYFDYEELKSLKEVVLEKHEHWKKYYSQNENEEKIGREVLESEKETESQAEEGAHILDLPEEVLLLILKYLNVKERIRFSSVCKAFNTLVFSTPSFWRHILPVQWTEGVWVDRLVELDGEECAARRVSCWRDVDVEEHCDRPSVVSRLASFVLPRVGEFVETIILSGSFSLSSYHLQGMLLSCPNLVKLDVSYTCIGDSAFKGLSEKGCCKKLKHVDLSGCINISDDSICNLALCFTSCRRRPRRSMRSGLRYFSVSGCEALTDTSLNIMQQARRMLSSVEYLDFSGCWQFSGPSLGKVIQSCPLLNPENLYYCDMIQDGPYQLAANGCRNLASSVRRCCITGQ